MDSVDTKFIINEIVNKYFELVKQHMNVEQLYLFGSYSKGNYTIESDIDIAIVSDDFSGDIINDRLILMKLRRNIDTRIEPHPFLLKDFNLNNPFVSEIVKTGIRII